VATGNLTGTVPDAVAYHVVVSDRLGSSSNGIPDDPSAAREISLAVGTGNVALG